MFGDLASAILGLFANLFGIEQNAGNVARTNATNLKIAQDTNQSNVEQAEIAYNRSLPITQVRNLMDAGMSKTGALSTLTGGGSYSAPTLQSAHIEPNHIDMSGINSAIERLGDIPSNVEQRKLVESQRHDLEVSTQNKIAEEERKRELHQYDIWEKNHGQRAAIMLDEGSSLISQRVLDKGDEFKDYASFEDMLKDLGLQNEPVFRNMPHGARGTLEESARAKFDAARAKKEQENKNRAANDTHLAAKDAHTAALDALKNSEAERVLKHHQVNKLIADTEQSWQHVQEFDDATDARQKENAARAAKADFEKIMTNFGLSKSDIYNSNFYYMDKDGNIHLTEKARVKKGFEEAWKFAGSFFGVDLLKDILSGLVAISPK